MKLYQFIHEPDAKPIYRGTRAEVKADAKEVAAKLRFASRIYEINMNTDKDALVLLLNKGEPVNATVVRSWSVTPRGGLSELEA